MGTAIRIAWTFLIAGALWAQTSAQQIVVLPRGDNSATGELRWRELYSNGQHFVGLKAPSAIGSSFVWTLPDEDGAANECLVTNGAGLLSFAACGSGGSSGDLPVADTTSLVKGSADATKAIRFEVDGLSAATTRVLTVPNADITLVGRENAETISGQKTFSDMLLAAGNVEAGNGAPTYQFYESDGALNEKYTRLYTQDGTVWLDIVTDDYGSSTAFFSAERSGVTPGAFKFWSPSVEPGTNNFADLGSDARRWKTTYGYNADFAAGGVLNNYTKVRKLEIADAAGGTSFWDVQAAANGSVSSSMTIRDNGGSEVIQFVRQASGAAVDFASVYVDLLPDANLSQRLGAPDLRWSKLWTAEIDMTGTFTAGGGVSSPATSPLTATGSGFKYYPNESQHVAFYRVGGNYAWYWRTSDTGYPGASGERTVAYLDETLFWTENDMSVAGWIEAGGEITSAAGLKSALASQTGFVAGNKVEVHDGATGNHWYLKTLSGGADILRLVDNYAQDFFQFDSLVHKAYFYADLLPSDNSRKLGNATYPWGDVRADAATITDLTTTALYTGSVTASGGSPLIVTGTDLKYFPSESQHVAYYKRGGGYCFYWRKSDTGYPGAAGEAELASLCDDGTFTVGDLTVTGTLTGTIAAPANMVTTDTVQTISAAKTFGPLTSTAGITSLQYDLYHPGAPADEKKWRWHMDGTGWLRLQSMTDSYAGADSILGIQRTSGMTTGPFEIYKNLSVTGSITASSTLTATDATVSNLSASGSVAGLVLSAGSVILSGYDPDGGSPLTPYTVVGDLIPSSTTNLVGTAARPWDDGRFTDLTVNGTLTVTTLSAPGLAYVGGANTFTQYNTFQSLSTFGATAGTGQTTISNFGTISGSLVGTHTLPTLEAFTSTFGTTTLNGATYFGNTSLPYMWVNYTSPSVGGYWAPGISGSFTTGSCTLVFRKGVLVTASGTCWISGFGG